MTWCILVIRSLIAFIYKHIFELTSPKTYESRLIADGSIHIFDEYIGTVLWNDEVRTVEVAAAETDPLVGMGLLRGYSLSVDVVENGAVMIESLTL